VRLITLGVAAVASALYLVGLGSAPFLDPPEGFHSQIAWSMLQSGEWVTPHLDGVRYFDKPPLLYWLLSLSFAVFGPTPLAARLPTALAAIGCAGATARLGIALGGPRVGFLAGLMVAANLGMFLFGRLVKPDVLFVLCIVLGFAGFAAAYLGRTPRRGLALFYGGLALATISKDILGAVAPWLAIAILFFLTRERPLGPWCPAWGVGLFVLVALPWYAAMEWQNHGFLWYTFVDNHLLNLIRQRAFPDEDVPLGALEFLLVSVAAFLPWSLAAPWAVTRALRRPWTTAIDRLWALLAIWVILVVGFFTLSPFKLPHYALPAFPAMALLVARLLDAALSGEDGAPRVRAILIPVVALLAVAAVASALAWTGALRPLGVALGSVDLTTRNFAARGQAAPGDGLQVFRPLVATVALVLGAGAVGAGVALRRRRPEIALAVSLGAVLAFLPIAGRGMGEFARTRSVAPITETLLLRLRPGDLVVHEGAIENSASMLLALGRPVYLVDAMLSNLAFGATFPEARAIVWDHARLREAWNGPQRVFLVSVAPRERSVVRGLPPDRVHRLEAADGRWLYSNRGD
jgi:4-amino-4-deoxy-L-arabinose transferase-like glycosyltransferase